MVQLKYFGDSRDYFKYDLITYLLQQGLVTTYVFVPMLTNHRIDGEGNKLPKHVEGKSHDLLSFIDSCKSKDLTHWENWLAPQITEYKTIQPVNATFFDDVTRRKYWQLFEKLLKEESALIFIDPDTGLETGKPSYLMKMGREKYLLNDELGSVFESVDESSVLMIYQHLPNNKHIHKESVSKKVAQAVSSTRCQNVMAYREDDLAFIFIVKSDVIYASLRLLLEKYHVESGHKYKSIHFVANTQKDQKNARFL